jgi:hypothetical protein
VYNIIRNIKLWISFKKYFNFLKGGENKKWLSEKKQRKKELLKKQRRKKQRRRELLKKQQRKKQRKKDRVFLTNKKSSLRMD